MSMFHQLKKLYWLQQNAGFKPRLPAEYEELEFIYTANSTTFIDTGLKASALDEYTCKAALTAANSNCAFIGDGYSKTDSNVAIWLDRRTTPSYKAEFSFGDGGNAYYKVVFNDSSFDVSEMHEYKMSIPTKSAYVDGTFVGTASSVSAFANSRKLVLFGSWRNNGTNSTFAGKMGECSIVRDGVEIRRFVPAMRKSDGVCGFYDLCGNNSPVWPYDTPFYTGQYAERILPGRPADPAKCNIEYLAPEKLTLYADDYVREHKFSNGKGTLVLDIVPSKTFSWFQERSTVTSVKLTGYETVIGTSTFQGGLNALTEVLNMDNIETINYQAFYGCSALRMTALPPKLDLDSCGNGIFNGCSSITVSELPAGTKEIHEGTFEGCTNLALASLPSTVTTISAKAFHGCSAMTCSTLPAGLTFIGDSAFSGCTNISFSQLPSGLTHIGNSAFYNSGVSFSSIPSGITAIAYGTFYGCSNITSMSLPEGLESLGNSTFRNCTGITEMTLPSSLTSIGNSAFDGCTNMACSTLPAGLTTLGDYVFRECRNVTFSTLPSGITELLSHTFFNCNKVTFSSLPEGLTAIGDAAFQECSSITSMTLPSTLQTLATNAFRYTGLASITIPAAVSTVGASAFQACTSLTTVTFEGTPTSIGADAFFGCTALTDIYCAWTEGTVADAPWGAPSTTTIHYAAS